MNGKFLWQSKTFWLNLIAMALQIGLPDLVPQPYGMITLAALNIGNRLLTNQPIKISVE